MKTKEIIIILENHWRSRRFNLGMTRKEVLGFLREVKISIKIFWKRWGVNTCALDEETGKVLYYKIDI